MDGKKRNLFNLRFYRYRLDPFLRQGPNSSNSDDRDGGTGGQGTDRFHKGLTRNQIRMVLEINSTSCTGEMTSSDCPPLIQWVALIDVGWEMTFGWETPSV